MLTLAFFLAVLVAQDAQSNLDAGKAAYAKRDYAEAAAKFSAAADAAAAQPGNAAGVIDALRLLAGVRRESGDPGAAAAALQRAIDQCKESEPNSLKLAGLLEELASAERVQDHGDAALAALQQALEIRGASRVPSVERARDLTVIAMLRYAAGAAAGAKGSAKRAVGPGGQALDGTDPTGALAGFESAIREWDAAAPGDPQVLPAIEALANAYREDNQFKEAEPLLLRALRVRESTYGPESSEVISDLDSLAFVQTPLNKLEEAEANYQRLLALWRKLAGPDHPMVANTLEKMATFYTFRQRYVEAEACSSEAVALRAKAHIEEMHQEGRILIMQSKYDDAADLYRRLIAIGDAAKIPEALLEAPVALYAGLLKQLDRNEEAAVVTARSKEMVARRLEKQGLRPVPPGARILGPAPQKPN